MGGQSRDVTITLRMRKIIVRMPSSPRTECNSTYVSSPRFGFKTAEPNGARRRSAGVTAP